MNAPLNLNLTPEQAVRAWPADWRLAVLWSGGGNARSRWTLLAKPTGEVIQSPDGTGTRWPRTLEKPVAEHMANMKPPPVTNSEIFLATASLSWLTLSNPFSRARFSIIFTCSRYQGWLLLLA